MIDSPHLRNEKWIAPLADHHTDTIILREWRFGFGASFTSGHCAKRRRIVKNSFFIADHYPMWYAFILISGKQRIADLQMTHVVSFAEFVWNPFEQFLHFPQGIEMSANGRVGYITCPRFPEQSDYVVLPDCASQNIIVDNGSKSVAQ